MANVDLTLRLTNPAIYNQLQSWATNGITIRVNLQINGLANINQQLQGAIGNIAINPVLGNAAQLTQQVQAAINNANFNPGGGGGGNIAGGVFRGGLALELVNKAADTARDSLVAMASAIKNASDKGLEFQRNVLGIAAALSVTSKVTNANGSEASISDTLKFQQGRAQELLTGTRRELSPLGIGQAQQAGLLRGVITGAQQGGFNLSTDQTVKLTKIIGGVTAVANEDLFQNLPRLVNDTQELLANPALAKRNQIGQQFKPVLKDITAAQATGDTDKLIKAFEKYKSIVDALTLSTESAAVAFNKLNAVTQQLQVSFGDAFNRALVPGLQSLVDVLRNPEFERGLTNLGEDLGQFVNVLIEQGADLLRALNIDDLETGLGQFVSVIEGTTEALLTAFSFVVNPIGTDLTTSYGGGFQQTLEANQTNRIQERNLNEKKAALGQAAIRTGTDSGTGAFIPVGGLKSTPIVNPEIELNKTLRGIDTETPEGKFQADQLKRQFEITQGTGTSSADVLQAQGARASALFGIAQEQKGLNTQTAAGSLYSGILGREAGVVNGSTTGNVTQQQNAQAVQDATVNLTTGFLNLLKSVNDSATAMELQANRGKELALEYDIAKKNLADLGASQRLNSLTGADKLIELQNQIEAGGGRVDLGLRNQVAKALPLGQGGFSDLSTPEERKQAILQQQYEVEAKKLTGKGDRDKLEQLNAQDSVTKAKGALDNAEVDKALAKANNNQQILDFATKFGDEKAEKYFGKDAASKARTYFGEGAAEATGISSFTSTSSALDKIFGSGGNYYTQVQAAFKAALQGSLD